MKWKKAIKYLLLVFVATTLIVQVGKSFRQTPQAELPDGLSVVVCHAQVRCPTCTTMEKLSRECLEEFFPDRAIAFVTLNYEATENREIAEKYGVATATVLLVRRENGTEEVKNLVTPAWQTIGDAAAFKHMLRENLSAFIAGDTLKETPESAETAIPQDLDTTDLWDE